MLDYAIKRIGLGFLILVVTMTAMYAAVFLIPGDPAAVALALTIVAIGWAFVVGVSLGCLSVLYRGSWLDRITGVLSVGFIAVPSFVVAIYALLLFSVELHWFPAIGAGRIVISSPTGTTVNPAARRRSRGSASAGAPPTGLRSPACEAFCR
jgi:ABC-type dipeptide/oligopeptide/nickel transport system permease component